jgi:hypothetical protein
VFTRLPQHPFRLAYADAKFDIERVSRGINDVSGIETGSITRKPPRGEA